MTDEPHLFRLSSPSMTSPGRHGDVGTGDDSTGTKTVHSSDTGGHRG